MTCTEVDNKAWEWEKSGSQAEPVGKARKNRVQAGCSGPVLPEVAQELCYHYRTEKTNCLQSVDGEIES